MVKIFQLKVNGVPLFSRNKTRLIFCPEANSFFEHLHYRDHIVNSFRDLGVITLKENKGYPGILNTADIKARMTAEIDKSMNIDAIMISNQFFTNSFKNQKQGLRLSPDEMLMKFEKQLKAFERRYYTNTRHVDKAPVAVISGKGPSSQDDIILALILIFYGINVFYIGTKYQEYRK